MILVKITYIKSSHGQIATKTVKPINLEDDDELKLQIVTLKSIKEAEEIF